MVDFRLTDQQQMMRDMVRDFASGRMRPLAEKYYRQDQRIPEEELETLIKEANQLRLLDYYYSEEVGGLGHKLADMEVEINAARLLTWRAGWMVDEDLPLARGEGSQAKYKASEVAVQVCLDAIQIHGGYGFMKEYDVGRWLNDSLIYRIWEGTSEIQKNTIARYLSNLS